ncbi:MAG: hypothetical protein IPK31_14355 [Chitinophagaceae bacterium]|nr:hypothetical protein [Chitinophagaceae bacterium]
MKLIFICTLFFISNSGAAQKGTIAVSGSLSKNADVLNVKMGTQWFGKIWKFRFGDYEVVSSKLNWTTASNKASLFNRKTESTTTEKFSFLLTNHSADTARVNAARRIKVNGLREIEILPHFSIGSDELLSESGNFTAFININEDTANTWALFLSVFRTNVEDKYYDAFLTNGERRILILPVTSNDNRSIPSLGYEFQENGEPLCAVQYYGGGAMGTNKNIIWLSKSIDKDMKMILAAAMTSLLQIKAASPSPGL